MVVCILTVHSTVYSKIILVIIKPSSNKVFDQLGWIGLNALSQRERNQRYNLGSLSGNVYLEQNGLVSMDVKLISLTPISKEFVKHQVKLLIEGMKRLGFPIAEYKIGIDGVYTKV